MTRPVVTINPSQTAYDAARIMSRENKSGLVIVEKDKPVGVITERDLVNRVIVAKLDPTTVKVGEVMSQPPITISSHLFIEDAAKVMAEKKVKRLPVVENDRLVGIITVVDLTHCIDRLEHIRPSILRTYKRTSPQSS